MEAVCDHIFSDCRRFDCCCQLTEMEFITPPFIAFTQPDTKTAFVAINIHNYHARRKIVA